MEASDAPREKTIESKERPCHTHDMVFLIGRLFLKNCKNQGKQEEKFQINLDKAKWYVIIKTRNFCRISIDKKNGL